eukprot:9377342-Pyramimonas_sp.AAC.2
MWSPPQRRSDSFRHVARASRIEGRAARVRFKSWQGFHGLTVNQKRCFGTVQDCQGAARGTRAKEPTITDGRWRWRQLVIVPGELHVIFSMWTMQKASARAGDHGHPRVLVTRVAVGLLKEPQKS